MVQGNAGKGDKFRKVNKEKFDMNYLKIFALCNQHYCPHNWACYRYMKGVGNNNKTYVPKPNNHDVCKFYLPARCELCKGKGWNEGFDKIQKRFLKTTCLICKGTGVLNFKKEKKNESGEI